MSDLDLPGKPKYAAVTWRYKAALKELRKQWKIRYAKEKAHRKNPWFSKRVYPWDLRHEIEMALRMFDFNPKQSITDIALKDALRKYWWTHDEEGNVKLFNDLTEEEVQNVYDRKGPLKRKLKPEEQDENETIDIKPGRKNKKMAI